MRWKLVIPVTLVVLAGTIVSLFLLDPILQRMLIASGEAIFGARVDVASLKTRFKDMSVTVTGLSIADKTDPWRNVLSIDSLRFSMRPLPLLSKKLIIKEMALEGISWGTRRATSGALPPRRKAALAKRQERVNRDSASYKLFAAIQEKGAREVSQLPPVASLSAARNAFKNLSLETVVASSGLSSLKEMAGMKDRLRDTYAMYQTTITSINIDERSAALRSLAEDIAKTSVNSVQDVAALKDKIDRFSKEKAATEKTVAALKSLQARAAADFGDQKELLARINALKEKDVALVSEKLKLPVLNMEGVTRSLFGPMWISRVQTAVYYMHMARRYMPPRKPEEKKIMRTRLRGTDVAFPLKDNPPDLLVSRITLRGTTGGPGKPGDPLLFAGTVMDVTSDPVMLGRPTLAHINGQQAQKHLSIDAVFNHVAQVPEDSITIAFAGLHPAELGIPSSDYLPAFENGTADVNACFRMRQDAIDCTLDLTISHFSFVRSSGAVTDDAHRALASLWDGISSIQVTARATGPVDALAVTVTSSIDKVLTERMKRLMGDTLAQAQSRVRAEIDKRTDQAKKELLDQLGSQKDAVLKLCEGRQHDLQSYIDAAKAQVSGRENEAKDRADREKKNAEEALKKQAGDKLKDLFKL